MYYLYKTLSVFTLLLFYAGISIAQSIHVDGIIKCQEDQSPLVGANILAIGTQNGTISDEKGRFSIDIPKNTVLRVSELGYETREITVNSTQSELKINLLRSTNALNELVVTALNISKEKKSLGYSVQELKSEEFNKAKEPNLVNALSGKISGVRVTNSQGGMGSSRIIIRGETSISGNNQPLFVIDGVPVDNTQHSTPGASRDFSNAIADLNPDDIASISVLKGPNAAALYGSRAAAGVILIQTKDGTKSKGLGITINSNTVISDVLILPDYQNIFGQGLNGEFTFVDGQGGGINDAVDESWGPKMEGQLIPQFYSNGKPVPFEPHPNNVKNYFKTGYKFNNGVSIARSGDHYNFRVSYNNMVQHGILPNTEQQKNSFSVKANYDLTSKLSLGAYANYIRRDAPNLPGLSGRANSTMLQFAWFGRQVSTQKLYEVYKQGSDINWNNLYYSNLYANAYNNTTSQVRNRLIGNIHLNYDITKDLTATFRTGNDHYTDKRKSKIAFGTKGTPYGSYAEDAYLINENNTSLNLNYNHRLHSNFNLDIVAGGNIRSNVVEDNFQKTSRLAVPGIYTLENTRVPATSSNHYEKLKTYSLFSSAQIGFKDYAYLNLTARNDWSSSLPKAHQSYFYPSVNGSFILSEALHLTDHRISLIKLRGGWSKVGKATSAYQLQNTYRFVPPFGEYPQLLANSTEYNPHLKPEETTSVEAGIELGLWKNRVHLDASFYNMNSYNQILAVDISASTGYRKKLINGGKINNRGFEVSLGLNPIHQNNLDWNIGLNYSKNSSKVVRLNKENSITSYSLGSSGTVQLLASTNLPYGALFGNVYLRDDEGHIIIKSDGLPATNPNKQYLGKYTPDWLGSISNELTYHNFQLSFLIDASFGGSIYSGTNSTGSYTGVLASTLPGRDAEHGGLRYYYPDNDQSQAAVALPEGTAPKGEQIQNDGMIFDGVYRNGKENSTIVPAQDYYKSTRNVDELYTYSSSYVKLREVKLGYNFTGDFLKAIGLQSASVSLVGRNLWIIHKKAPNIDPETAFSTDNGGQGLESLGLPSVRSFGININLNF